MITQYRLKEVIHYDPETGIMKWIFHHQRPDMLQKKLGSIDSGGYVKVWIDHNQYRVHRLAFLYMNGSIPKLVDHINGNRSDNRWINLRESNKSENAQNMKRAKKDSTTGFLGVHVSRNKFTASIITGGKNKYLGSFDTPEKAHESYLTEKRKSHKGNTL